MQIEEGTPHNQKGLQQHCIVHSSFSTSAMEIMPSLQLPIEEINADLEEIKGSQQNGISVQ